VEPERLAGAIESSNGANMVCPRDRLETSPAAAAAAATKEARTLAKQWDEADRRVKKEAKRTSTSRDGGATTTTTTKSEETSAPKIGFAQVSAPSALTKKRGLRKRPGAVIKISTTGALHHSKRQRLPFPSGKFRSSCVNGGQPDNNTFDEEGEETESSSPCNDDPAAPPRDDTPGDLFLVEARLVEEEPSAANVAADDDSADVEANQTAAATASSSVPLAEIVDGSVLAKCIPTSARGAWLCFGLCFLLASVTIASVVCGTGLCVPQEADPVPPDEHEPMPMLPASNNENWTVLTTTTPPPVESPVTATTVTLFGLTFHVNNAKRLTLPSKGLQGGIPTEIGLFTALTSLGLSQNPLTGPMPTEIGLMTSLVNLDFGGNALTGRIPSEFGLMTNLKHVQLNANQVAGTLPSQLGLLTELTCFGGKCSRASFTALVLLWLISFSSCQCMLIS